MLPISIVESKSFRDLMALVEPQYCPPCRQTMMSRMTTMKKRLVEKMSAHIEANVKEIAVTTDIWTSVTNEAYLSFTASYIDPDWTMKTPILATIPMHDRHTQAIIAEHLGNVADDWSIKNKVVACVHDGASNVKDVGNMNGWFDVQCAAHKLQLCINNAMGTHAVTNHPISKCVSAASRLVGHFSHSPMAVGELMKRQVSMDSNKTPLKLIQHCKTRWNSVYDMFERLSQLRWPVVAVLSDRNVVKLNDAKALDMKDEYWQLLTELLPVLKALQIVTSVMSAESQPSASCVFPMLWGLMKNHLIVNEEDSKVLGEFKKDVGKNISQRFAMAREETATNECVIASVLDPMYKHLPGSDDEFKKRAYDYVRHLIREMPASLEQPSTSGDASDSELPAKRSRPNHAAVMFLLGDSASQQVVEDSDFETYIKSPWTTTSTETALEWWKQNDKLFPKTANLARKFLCIPATSVQSERLFSATGRLISDLRNRLLPEHAESLVFLNKNQDLFEF